MKYCIYGIVDPRDEQIFYIGQTRNYVRRREQHREGTDQLSGLMVRIIKENGLVPLFVILERCPSEEAALFAEVSWIDHFRRRGAKLSNSQAFSGYAARNAERQARTKALEGMQKKQRAKLRDVANGKHYSETDRSKGQAWSAREVARLKGMLKHNYDLDDISSNLGRSRNSVKAKIKRISQAA